MLAGSVAALVLDLRSAGLPVGFDGIILIGTVLIVLASAVLHAENAMPPGEFQFLLGSAAAGGLVIVGAEDLITLIVGLGYSAVHRARRAATGDRRAIGSAWTFFLTSVVATAITLMGIAMLYGLAGSLRYGELGWAERYGAGAAFSIGLVLTLIGFLFKIGASLSHAWVPDAYRGASPIVTAFLSSVSKAAVLGALLVLVYVGFPPESSRVSLPLVAVVAVVSMTAGDLGALRQRTASPSSRGRPSRKPDSCSLPRWSATRCPRSMRRFVPRGLRLGEHCRLRGSRSRLEGARVDVPRRSRRPRTDRPVGRRTLAFAVLVLAGFPPAVIGLVAKYVVFVPVVSGGWTWVAVVMAINVMIGLAYYLRFVATLFAPADRVELRSVGGSAGVRLATFVVVVGALALLAASVWPSAVLDFVVPVTIDANDVSAIVHELGGEIESRLRQRLDGLQVVPALRGDAQLVALNLHLDALGYLVPDQLEIFLACSWLMP